MIMLSTAAAGAQKLYGITLNRIKCRLLRDDGVMFMGGTAAEHFYMASMDGGGMPVMIVYYGFASGRVNRQPGDAPSHRG